MSKILTTPCTDRSHKELHVHGLWKHLAGVGEGDQDLRGLPGQLPAWTKDAASDRLQQLSVYVQPYWVVKPDVQKHPLVAASFKSPV